MSTRPTERLLRNHIRKRLDPVVEELEAEDILANLQPGETVNVISTSPSGSIHMISHVTRVPQQGTITFPLQEQPGPCCPIPSSPARAKTRPNDPAEEKLTLMHLAIEKQGTSEPKSARKIIKDSGYEWGSHTRKALALLVRLGRLERPRRDCYVAPAHRLNQTGPATNPA